MAKRKKRTTNTRNTGKRKTNKKQQNKSKLDIEVVALFVLSILLAVLIYAKSGIIGENLNIVLGGIMGWLKYILPIGTFIMAIYMVIDEEQKESFAGKIINYTVFLICLMSIMTIYQISKGSLNISIKSIGIRKSKHRRRSNRSSYCNSSFKITWNVGSSNFIYWNCINKYSIYV